MSLNKSTGNMYDFISYTWNPLIGQCPHKCSYCSTNKFYYPSLIERYSGKIRLDEKCLKDNLGKDRFIFVCSQNDLFANDVPDEFIHRIIEYCKMFDNKYLFQTKNPIRIRQFELPINSVVCTTIETDRRYLDAMRHSPLPINRVIGMTCIDLPKYVTIEPIMDFDLETMVEYIKIINPVQVNIGCDSGNNNLVEPSSEKIHDLVTRLRSITKVKLKSNLKRLYVEKEI